MCQRRGLVLVRVVEGNLEYRCVFMLNMNDIHILLQPPAVTQESY